MSTRFAGLTKLPQQPAARLMAVANLKLKTPLAAPATAGVEVVLAELEAKGAMLDMLKLMAVALPPRERVWWACLAARDSLEPGAAVPPPLAATEAWTYKPTEENLAEVQDDTVHAATAALFHDGTLGPGEFRAYEAPPGAAELSAFSMNLIAMFRDAALADAAGDVLLDRALDIARGGSGQIPLPVKEGVA